MSEGTDILFSPPVSRFSDRPGRGVRPRAKRLHGVPRDARMAPSCCIAATVESGRKKAGVEARPVVRRRNTGRTPPLPCERRERWEEHTSELQSLMHSSHAVFCLKQIRVDSRCNTWTDYTEI